METVSVQFNNSMNKTYTLQNTQDNIAILSLSYFLLSTYILRNFFILIILGGLVPSVSQVTEYFSC